MITFYYFIIDSCPRKVNIIENMIQKLEAYAINLEEIVLSRKEELVEEKEKSDALLYRMLPLYVPILTYGRSLFESIR